MIKPKLLLLISLTVLFGFFSTAVNAGESKSCSEFLLYSRFDKKSSAALLIESEQFEILTNRLRATLSGKLATVFRSEWKTKLSVAESNELVSEFIQSFLTPNARDKVLADLGVKMTSFTRMIHKRLFELKGQDGDGGQHLDVRDAPPPPGTLDTTFTFYLKSIKNNSPKGEGKHQVRIRNYVRLINVKELSNLKDGQTIEGFLADGNKFTIEKLAKDSFQVGNPSGAIQILNLGQLKESYGTEIKIFAPHGGKYKLEVKTSLLDKISSVQFEKMGGYHMVQKLDVSLTPLQMAKLFGPLTNKTELGRRSESIERIEQLKTQLIQKNPEGEQRIIAIFEVLREGVLAHSEYLQIEGATWYHRSAFESDLGFQLTVDRRQGVTHDEVYFEMSDPGNKVPKKTLLNPMEIMAKAHFLYAESSAARHVELKLPFFAVRDLLGLEFSSPETVAHIQTQPSNQGLLGAVKIYNRYVKSSDHPGKFQYLISNGQNIEDLESTISSAEVVPQ
jgi:hypothetical protein